MSENGRQILKTICPLDCPDTCSVLVSVERGIASGDAVRVFNDRGECQFSAEVTEDMRPGVVAAESIWRAKHSPGGRGINTLVSNRRTDLGGVSTFHCNLVEVSKK